MGRGERSVASPSSLGRYWLKGGSEEGLQSSSLENAFVTSSEGLNRGPLLPGKVVSLWEPLCEELEERYPCPVWVTRGDGDVRGPLPFSQGPPSFSTPKSALVYFGPS